MQDIFDSKQEANEYCRRFQNIGKLWTLYHIAQFSCFLDKIKDTYMKIDDYSRMLMDINRLIMVASMVELLNSRKDFVRFDTWIKKEGKNKEFQTRGVDVWHEYNKIHGCAEKFRTFFTKYLTKEEKIELMRSVQFWKGAEKEFFPLFCFKGVECQVNHSFCTFDVDKTKCPAYASKRRMQRGIRECADFLYTLRSKFVHEAQLFFLPKPLPQGVGGSSFLVDYVEYDFQTKKYSHKGSVMLHLFSNQFVKLGKKYLTQLIQAYLKAREREYFTQPNSSKRHQS